ncbi:HD domain-containing protein (plasmid) [Deinococcus radiomollis]|uniref:HD domain-containing phosphohydrolase n=1 Tax=Deinococcus radiomollis TaxID=468916 RepID=UPI0038927CB4
MVAESSSSDVHPFDWVDDIIYIIDEAGRLTFANTFALNAWNKHPHELLGLTFEEALPQITQEAQRAIRTALSLQQRTEFDTYGVRHQGWINVTLYPHRGGLIVQAKRLPRYAGTSTPADFDALTGCLTRTAFHQALLTIDVPQVLAIVDLNRLKDVNTLRGHSGGDAHIRMVARAVQEALPEGALMCRWGGDEFVILTSGQGQEELSVLLEHAQSALPAPCPGLTTYSVGLAVWEAGTLFERAFALADEGLQRHKAQLDECFPGLADLQTFVTFSQRLEVLRDPDDIIQHALDNLLFLLDFDQTCCFQLEEDQGFISHQALRPGAPPLPPTGLRMPVTGFVSKAQHSRTTVWTTDYPSEAERSYQRVAEGVKSVIVTPIFSQGQVIATLVLRSMHRWQTINPHMIKAVELTALRLEHALELRRAVGAVQATLEAGMLTLGLALEARDSETHGHTLRTATMAERLGEALGLSARDLSDLRQGAYLHDLGKLSVPDAVLRKPGKLTPEEWTVMQRHVTDGYDIANRIPDLSPAILSVIRSHHERWNGTGYPEGLAGTDIPLGARIFAVCDVYDALISDRPYKKAWSHEDATLEIVRQSGQQFDPDVVRVFLDVMGQAGDAEAS